MKLSVDDFLAGPGYEPGDSAEITIADGRITRVDARASGAGQSGLQAMPAIINAHDHARPMSSTSFGGSGRPLETWLPRLAVIPAADPYLAALCSLGRTARGGCTASVVHLTRPMARTPLPQEAAEIARAANDIGIAMAFAVSMRDMNPLVYGDHSSFLDTLDPALRQQVEGTWLRKPMDWKSQLTLVDDVAAAIAAINSTVHIDVQYGPNGPQWCSRAMLEAIAQASADTNRRIHMHLLETSLQRKWADEHFPSGIVHYLKNIGLLSARLTLAHCVWARSDELDMIAESGARIAVNPSSNLALYSGIAPAREMHARGVSVCLGLDGCTLDEDDDALREMRLFRLLNAGHSFSDGIRGAEIFQIACRNGRGAIGAGDGGYIQTGQPADLILIDAHAINNDAIMPVDMRELLYTRAQCRHIRAVIANGRKIVEDGQVLGVDFVAAETELRDYYRSAIGQHCGVLDTWDQLEPGLDRINRELAGCY